MILEQISDTTVLLWNMMGIFLPFFTLIGVFQLSLTLFCALKLVSKKKNIASKEESFIETLTFANLRISGIALTVGLIGTVYGLVTAMSHLAIGWETADQEILANTMQGASIALTSTLGALILARLWGDEINDGLIERIRKKYGIPDPDEISKKQLSTMKSISENLNGIRASLKKRSPSKRVKNGLTNHSECSKKSKQQEIEEKFFK